MDLQPLDLQAVFFIYIPRYVPPVSRQTGVFIDYPMHGFPAMDRAWRRKAARVPLKQNGLYHPNNKEMERCQCRN